MPHQLSTTVEIARGVRLLELPSPLTHLPRLSQAWGTDVWLKRDDLASLALAGNKARKLEFLLTDVDEKGADTVVTVGAAQSNHARAAAVAAAMRDLDCHLLLGAPPEPGISGNLLLASLAGASVTFVDGHELGDLDDLGRELCRELERAGRRPYFIPLGGSVWRGALGFVAGYLELVGQLATFGIRPSHLYVASASGGTHAGLEVGRAVAGSGPEIVGVAVGKGIADLRRRIAWLATETAGMIGLRRRWSAREVVLASEQVGAGYGAITTEGGTAIVEAMRQEGILFDPVYSGKALAAVRSDVHRGPSSGAGVVLWHTGGVPSVFTPANGAAILDVAGIAGSGA